MVAARSRVNRFELMEPSLEEIFIDMVGKPMHNTFLIARREYLERMRTNAFVIMTLFIPVLMFGASWGPLCDGPDLRAGKHMVVVAADRILRR